MKVVKGMMLTTHLHLVPMLRMHGGIPPITLYLNGVVLNVRVIYPCCVDIIKNGLYMFSLSITLFLISPFYIIRSQHGDGHQASQNV
jgi:hypothetical protein